MAQPADAQTGWRRVSTPYNGDGKGQLFTPEVGSQVLVGYEQGQAGSQHEGIFHHGSSGRGPNGWAPRQRTPPLVKAAPRWYQKFKP